MIEIRTDYVAQLKESIGRKAYAKTSSGDMEEYEYGEFLVRQKGNYTIPINYTEHIMNLCLDGKVRPFQKTVGIRDHMFGDFFITGFWKKNKEINH